MEKDVLLEPTSERLVRERIFTIMQGRQDFKDTVAQLSVLAYQLRDSKFTGQIVINMGQGGINSIVAVDQQKIT